MNFLKILNKESQSNRRKTSRTLVKDFSESFQILAQSQVAERSNKCQAGRGTIVLEMSGNYPFPTIIPLE